VTVENKIVQLQLWDTAGQERFHCLVPNYIRDAAIIVLVYDITSIFKKIYDKLFIDIQSFNNIPIWLKDAKETRGNDVKIILIGNKVDLADKRQVADSDGQKLAEEHKIPFFETSAKDGTNVKLVFLKVASILPGLDNVEIQPGQDVMSLRAPETTEVNKKGCCK